MEARMPMIMTTIINSTSVNPRSRLVADTGSSLDPAAACVCTAGACCGSCDAGALAPAPGIHFDLLAAGELQRQRCRLALAAAHVRQRRRVRRSEEHTSELQSRLHLV